MTLCDTGNLDANKETCSNQHLETLLQDTDNLRNLYAAANLACLLDSNDGRVRTALDGYADRLFRYIFGAWPPRDEEVKRMLIDASTSDPALALTDAEKMKLLGADTDVPLVIARKYVKRQLMLADEDTRDNVIRYIANVLLPLTGQEEPEYLKLLKSELGCIVEYQELAFNLNRLPMSSWSDYDDGDVFVMLAYMLSIEDGLDDSERDAIKKVYKESYEEQTFEVRRNDMRNRLVKLLETHDNSEDYYTDLGADVLKSRPLPSARKLLVNLTEVAKADGQVSDEEAEFISKIVVKAGLSMDTDYMMALLMNEASKLHRDYPKYKDKPSMTFDYACLVMFYDDVTTRMSLWDKLVEYEHRRFDMTISKDYATQIRDEAHEYVFGLQQHLLDNKIVPFIMNGSKPWFFLCWVSEIAQKSSESRMLELSKMMYIIDQGKAWDGLFVGISATIADLKPYIEYAAAGQQIPSFNIATVAMSTTSESSKSSTSDASGSEDRKPSTAKKFVKWGIYVLVIYLIAKACS